VPEAEMIPPGIDLSPFVPVPPSDRARPIVVHAPSHRPKKGTDYVIAACAQLPVELDIVERVPHDEARERYARADIIVDQLLAGWYGIFALEAMALGKPVVTYLKPDAVEQTERHFGTKVPVVSATTESLLDVLRPLVESPQLRREIGAASRAYVERVHDIDTIADRLLEVYARLA
jgi:glycosyltransferase involved in cell wall biosynthesis